MNRPIDIVFVVGIPVVLALVLCLVVFSGRLSARTRAWLEFALGVLFYLVSASLFGWRGVRAGLDGHWLAAATNIGVLVALTVWGVIATIRHRPRMRGPESHP